MACSDRGFKVTFTEGLCDDVVSGVTAVTTAAATAAAAVATAAADLADAFMGEVLKLENHIQCAAPHPPQRGEPPRWWRVNGPARLPRHSVVSLRNVPTCGTRCRLAGVSSMKWRSWSATL